LRVTGYIAAFLATPLSSLPRKAMDEETGQELQLVKECDQPPLGFMARRFTGFDARVVVSAPKPRTASLPDQPLGQLDEINH